MGGDALVVEVGLSPAWGAKKLPAKELSQWSSGPRARTSDPSGGIWAFSVAFHMPGAMLAALPGLLSPLIKVTHYPDPPCFIWGN